MPRPRLTFFCELPPAELSALFADGRVLADLQAMQAGVSLGLLDLSDERAAVARRLQAAGLPMTAWLLLPREQGYWFNLDNAEAAAARYEAFRQWSAAHALRWEGVGLDIEPDIREMDRLLRGDWRMVGVFWRRWADGGRLRRASAIYTALVARLRADGYRAESYQFPIVADERRVGSTLLQRALGILDLSVDREIFMLYSSFMRPWGPALIASYARQAGSVGVGSTGGGVDAGDIDVLPPLDAKELARDMSLAAHWRDEIHIFSLEGCVRQDLLPVLREWTPTPVVQMPAGWGAIEGARHTVRGFLWLAQRPWVFIVGLLLGGLLLGRLRRGYHFAWPAAQLKTRRLRHCSTAGRR